MMTTPANTNMRMFSDCRAAFFVAGFARIRGLAICARSLATPATIKFADFPARRCFAAWTVWGSCLLTGLLAATARTGWCGQPTRANAPVVRTMTNSIDMQLARIPAGKFTMGSPLSEVERENEEVPHTVEITRPFYMGVYEVCQAEFAAVMGRREQAIFRSGNGGSDEHPMEDVYWKDAVAFCDGLSARAEEKKAGRLYRLPSEAEWEYACRAGSTTTFSFGDSLSSSQANFNGNYPYGQAKRGPYLRKTAKVGSYQPNRFGLYDMHGNVAEWCADFYDKNYYRDSPREDPLGPPLGVISTDYNRFYLVIRGGSWLDDARGCRSAYRYRAMPRNRYRIIGFRVVCDIEGDEAE